METAKPRKLGRGLSALLGEPVAITLPPVEKAAEKTVSPSAISVREEVKTIRASATEMLAATAAAQSQRSGSVSHAAREEHRPLTPRAAVGGTGHTNEKKEDRAPGSESRGTQNHEETAHRVVMVPVGAIEPGKFQPRRVFDEAQLRDLAASIKSAGVVQPILVRPMRNHAERGGTQGQGIQYELIAGERRWRASKLAGLATVPAVVSVLSDEQAAEWSLIENVQRTDLTVMEKAYAVRGLCERFGLTQGEVAEKLGMDRSSAANLIRLTELEKEVRDLLESGALSAGHGKALLGVPKEKRVWAAQQAAKQGWSVRRLEQAVEGLAGGPPEGREIKEPHKVFAKAAALRDLEKQLSEHMGTGVKIRANAAGTKGSLVIRFYDLDHFDGLMGKMGFRGR